MVHNPRRGKATWLGMAQHAGVVQAQTLQAQEELARARDAHEQLARTQEAQELPTSAVQAGLQNLFTGRGAGAGQANRPKILHLDGTRPHSRVGLKTVSPPRVAPVAAGRAAGGRGPSGVLGQPVAPRPWPSGSGPSKGNMVRAGPSAAGTRRCWRMPRQHRPCWPRRS